MCPLWTGILHYYQKSEDLRVNVYKIVEHVFTLTWKCTLFSKMCSLWNGLVHQ